MAVVDEEVAAVAVVVVRRGREVAVKGRAKVVVGTVVIGWLCAVDGVRRVVASRVDVVETSPSSTVVAPPVVKDTVSAEAVDVDVDVDVVVVVVFAAVREVVVVVAGVGAVVLVGSVLVVVEVALASSLAVSLSSSSKKLFQPSSYESSFAESFCFVVVVVVVLIDSTVLAMVVVVVRAVVVVGSAPYTSSSP